MTDAPGFAVLDLETTGFGGTDRVIEIGVVHLAPDLSVERTWETLVQPNRDISNTFVHGISATDVVGAPLFADIANDLAALLQGRIPVAHNAQFERRFLTIEFRRLGVSTEFTQSPWLDTMELSQRLLGVGKLEDALHQVGLRNRAAHSALADAEATAALLAHLAAQHTITISGIPPVEIPDVGAPSGTAVVLRGERNSQRISHLVRATPAAAEADSPDLNHYRELLREALTQRTLDNPELAASAARLPTADINDLHEEFLRQLAIEAWMDGIITADERAEIVAIAAHLGIDPTLVETLLAAPASTRDLKLEAGDAVAFTGSLDLPRATWEERVRGYGFTVSQVTKTTRLLVAANVDSMSGKAKRARKYSIPIITEAEFAQLLWRFHVPGMEIVASQDDHDPQQWSRFAWLAEEPETATFTSPAVAAVWINRYPSRPLHHISSVLPVDTVIDLSNSSAERAARAWLDRFPRMLEATVEDLRDLPGVGSKRLASLVEAVVLAALDAQEVLSTDVYMEDTTPAPEWAPQDADADLLVLAGWHELQTGAPIDPRLSAALPQLSAAVAQRDAIEELFKRCVDDLERACANDERFRIIARRRFFEDATLEEIGQEFGVTRERIRQLVQQLTASYRRDSELTQAVAQVIATRIGPMQLRSRIEAELPQLSADAGFGGSYGDYFRLASGQWEENGQWLGSIGFVTRAEETLQQLDNGYGVVSIPELADALGIPPEDATHWLAEQPNVAALPGTDVVVRARSHQDRAVGVLALAGTPLTIEEIAQRIGSDAPVRSISNALSADARVVKVSTATWALKDWGLAEFSTIFDWIGERIDAGGGSVTLQQLLAEAPALRISPSSVMAYANSAGYRVEDGTVTRDAATAEVIEDDPQDSRDMYLRDGQWHLLLTVTSDHLRGSGFAVPRGVAGIYHVPVDAAVEIPSRLGPQSVRVNKLKQPTTGTIRRFLLELGAQEGDRVWLRYDAEFDVIPAPRERRSETGLGVILDRMGLDIALAAEPDAALAAINTALGLAADAPRRRTVAVFGHRRQDELADIIRSL
ncbi:exonuclease domain-containing protein [Corynebacterium sp. TA-R-1]|uniref:Exonuclease domain-containing protein n=1 Tax=Corynebacterium stercoris TaxID=2943490 RepID=A0ABT1G101_9CORY|nr:exonuclease domain-containing protein [Corynebacterium stercoris]MCP1387704.1 exonuclease domain-containing protein [Corynebacterium stercoris]